MTLDFEIKIEQPSSVRPLSVMKDTKNSRYYADPLALLGERAFDEPQEIPDDVTGTPIQEYFRNKIVFLTGGTGFMGKALMEKLLRSCPHIKHMYLLIRPKKGKQINQRLEEIFTDRLFKRLNHEVPKYHEKVSAISGDCSMPGLGISDRDREKLQEEVHVIFHGAATVRFNEPLRQALAVNVKGTQAILDLAKGTKNLTSMVHVSTAFSNCPTLNIDEKFYEIAAPHQKIIQTINNYTDEAIEESLKDLLGKWPNTYTFTKAVAEQVIKNECGNLPIAIVRPSVVISTYREPVRGWIDNPYGPVGLIVGAATGVIHVCLGKKDMVTDMVPVDLAVNSIISTAWITAEESTKREEIKIYNYVSSTQNPLLWKDFITLNKVYGRFWPTIKAIWYYSFHLVESKNLFLSAGIFVHKIPGIILDTLARCVGQKPELGEIYARFDSVLSVLEYFSDKEWTFTNNNIQNLWKQMTPEDQEIFFFDMSQMSWEYHAEAHWLGLRVYLLKDDVETLPAARRKWRRLGYAHRTLQILLVLILISIPLAIFFFIFRFFSEKPLKF